MSREEGGREREGGSRERMGERKLEEKERKRVVFGNSREEAAREAARQYHNCQEMEDSNNFSVIFEQSELKLELKLE